MSGEALKEQQAHETLTILNLIVIFLSLYVLGALIVEMAVPLPPETKRLLGYIDNLICAFFFIEFCVNFATAKNKMRFMRWGWIDLVSSIPMIDALRGGRLFRLIELLRILRAFRSTKRLTEHVFRNKAQGTLSTVALLAVMLVFFSAIAILQVEDAPDSNIKTAEDAIWWAYVTITTVGYGDKYPVTTEGRIVAVILMTAGVALFGTFAAYVAYLFGVKPDKKE
jgi:voltage-gated potassium channel